MDNLHAEDAVWSAGSCLTLLEARPLRPLSFHHVHLHISACNVGKGVVVCTPQAFEDQPSVTRFWAYKPPSQIQTAATRTLTTRNVTCINTCISSLYIYINLRACIYIYIYLSTYQYLPNYLSMPRNVHRGTGHGSRLDTEVQPGLGVWPILGAWRWRRHRDRRGNGKEGTLSPSPAVKTAELSWIILDSLSPKKTHI